MAADFCGELSLSRSESFSRLANDDFSLGRRIVSSEPIKPLNRLSPRTFETFLRSPGVEDCPEDPPREKFPKAPIGGKPALCGAVDHGEESPFAPGLKGAVVLRLNAPNADEVSTDLPAAPLSLPFSSWWAS